MPSVDTVPHWLLPNWHDYNQNSTREFAAKISSALNFFCAVAPTSRKIKVCSWNIRGLREYKLDNDSITILITSILYVKVNHFSRLVKDKVALKWSGGQDIMIKNNMYHNCSLLEVNPGAFRDNIDWMKLFGSYLSQEIYELCKLYPSGEHFVLPN